MIFNSIVSALNKKLLVITIASRPGLLEVGCEFSPYLPNNIHLFCGNKMPTRCTTMSIIRNSRVLHKRLLPVVFGALVFKLSVWRVAEGYVSGLWAAAPNTTGSNRLCSTLEVLMMGIVVPEIC